VPFFHELYALGRWWLESCAGIDFRSSNRYCVYSEKAIADLGPAQVISFLDVALTEITLMILHTKEVVPMAQTQNKTMLCSIVDLASMIFTAIGIATFLGAALCPQWSFSAPN